MVPDCAFSKADGGSGCQARQCRDQPAAPARGQAQPPAGLGGCAVSQPVSFPQHDSHAGAPSNPIARTTWHVLHGV